MRKINVRLLAAALALGLFFGAAFAEEDDPVVVRVGDFTYGRSQVQSALDAEINLIEIVGGTWMTEEEKIEQRDSVIDRYIGVGLIQARLKEKGRNDFTDEEEESLKAAARNLYEQYWQGIWQKAQDSGEDFTEEQVTEYMEEAGYTISAFYEEYKASERRLRAIELFCPGLLLTEDMIQEYYEEQYLAPDREMYKDNINLYEEEILAQGNESFYTPAGYRAIKQILLEYPDAVTKALSRQRLQYNTLAQETAAALQNLAVAATTAEGWDDMIEPREAYDEAILAMTEAMEDYTQKRRELTLPLIQEKLDAIREEYEAGIDIDTIIRKYSADTNEKNLSGGGYPFHPDSPNWSEEFSAAASGLQQVGELSEPVFSDLGVHILYYAGDIPAGDHELTENEYETLKESALYYYQNLELEKIIEDWRSDYESRNLIETHPELLEIP